MAEIAPAAGPVVSILTLLPVRRQCGYFFYSIKYDRDMRAKKRELEGAAIDMRKKNEEYNVKSRKVPERVPGWLKEAEEIFGKVDSISPVGKRSYKAGKQCYNVIKDIERLMRERSNMEWTEEQKLLGMVSSATPQVPLQDVTENIFSSRKGIFQRALQVLEPDNPTQKVALCGMGGIGKTKMMGDLMEVVNKRFDWVIRVVVGKSTDPIAFQDAIAEYVGGKLLESRKEARADRLKERFLGMSQDGKNKILIVLDDLRNTVDLKDIGLASPLPKGFKLFLLSRYEQVCSEMGVETSSILKMVDLEKLEAKQLFWKTTELSDGAVDQELRKLGEDIVKRCGGLPMAIVTIALALKGEIKDAWKLTLSRLERHDLQDLQGRYDVVHDIFEISYNYLKKDDDQKIFILSGLFPDNFHIPLEDLMRYGWGLELFHNVRNLFEARLRTNASVSYLIRANLLVESDRKGCVKMHDLARSFVLSNISKFKQASIVNHIETSEWPTQDTRESCERILLKCKGMSEFPQHFDYPNLKFLKLIMNYYYEKQRLEFPGDFYSRMKQLQLISYTSIQYPSLPISLQYSTSLRMLCLRSCSLKDDLSYLGHLSNLEILSFAYCLIDRLPSAIGNLKKLKLLDLTGCGGDIRIGDGVFQNLDNLEELYMRTLKYIVISFTKDNCEGLEMVSKKLTALEVEFFKNNIRPDRVSFKKLERFRISIGCQLDPIYEHDVYPFENTLKLVASREEVRAFEVNELFEKTSKLHLQVEGIYHLEDVLMNPSIRSFGNLKDLSFEKCANLKYLFSVNVARTLINLETLTVKSSVVLESLIHDDNNGAEVIKFHKLKHLVLRDLPGFVGLCDNINTVMELPQLVELTLDDLPNFNVIFASSNYDSATIIPLLNKKVVSLEKLEIRGMNNLKEIWTCEEEDDTTPVLKKIVVEECDEIQNLFPRNPMRLLSHLEKLTVGNCGSIQALFDIDSEYVGQVNSSLRSIEARTLPKLREVWRIRGGENSGLLIRGFQAMKSIEIKDCENFRNIVTPTTIQFDMRALTTFIESSGDKWGRNNKAVGFIQNEKFSISWSLGQYSKELRIWTCHALSTVIPSSAAEQPQQIEVLRIYECSSLMEVFETKEMKNSPNFGQGSGSRDDTTLAAIPRLKSITTHKMPNLKILFIGKCHRLVDIFTFSTLGSLGLLEELTIRSCKELKVIVRKEHGAQATTTSMAVKFRCLKSIELYGLDSLEGFCLGNVDYSFPSLVSMKIKECKSLRIFTQGGLFVPELKVMETSLGNINVAEIQDINSFIITKTLEGLHF